MKISVIVPTYKPQAYLWECLDSIYNQTFPKAEYEVILVLNGCCEPYRTQIKEWMSRHSDMQVNFIQTDEGGVSNARNIALDEASGEYVAFIDDDDLISPTYLEELYEKATPDTVSLCYPYAFCDKKPEEQLQYGITDAYEYCVKNGCNSIASRVRKYFSGPCMKLIPMSFIQGRRFDRNFKNGEDTIFMFLISDKFRNITFTSRNAIYYRRYRKGSAATTKHSKKEEILNTIRCMMECTKIFLKGKYNLYFYASRIIAGLMYIIKLLIGGIRVR